MTSTAGLIDLLATNGGMSIAYIHAPRLNFTLPTAGLTLNLNDIEVSESIGAHADKVSFNNLVHTGSAPLHITINGGSKDLADQVTVNATSENVIVFDELHTDEARINAQTELLDLYDVIVSNRGEFNNKYYSVLTDNHYHGLEDFDAQLYPENTPFYLLFHGDRLINTDVYIVNYDPEFILNEPDVRNSFVREAEINLPVWAGSEGVHQTNYILTAVSQNGAESVVSFDPGNLGIEDRMTRDDQVIEIQNNNVR
jgi:hypothetical protein